MDRHYVFLRDETDRNTRVLYDVVVGDWEQSQCEHVFLLRASGLYDKKNYSSFETKDKQLALDMANNGRV